MKLPRIDLSRLQVSSLRGLLLHLTGRQRKIARWAGMGLLAIASFLVTLKYTFPYDRLKGKLVDVLSDKYDVTVGEVGGGFLPGTVVFDDVILRSRPTSPGEKSSEILVDELVVDLGLDFGLLGALRKRAVFDIEADLGGGEIQAEIEASESMWEAHVETEALALGKLPGVAAAVGLPMSGSLDADVELRLPGGKWKNAEGRIEIDCLECTVGDGVAKMTMTPSSTSSTGRRRRTSAGAAAFSSTGVTVPRLALGEAKVLVDISKGVGDIKTFSASSKDGWLKIEGKIEFRDPFPNTLFPGCMRFKLSDELKQRDPKFGNIEYTLSEKMRQQDGSFAIPTKGRLTELRWDVRRRCGGGSTEDDSEGTPAQRPALARPSLDPRTPPQGGEPVDPSQVPGVSGQGETATIEPHPPDGTGQPPEVPVPGASGPPLADEGAPQPQQPDDAGPAASQQAPGYGVGSDNGTLRRIQPDEPPPGEPPPPPPDQGEVQQPEGDQPPPQELPPDQQEQQGQQEQGQQQQQGQQEQGQQQQQGQQEQGQQQQQSQQIPRDAGGARRAVGGENADAQPGQRGARTIQPQ
jgi:type II secretion system protein N